MFKYGSNTLDHNMSAFNTMILLLRMHKVFWRFQQSYDFIDFDH